MKLSSFEQYVESLGDELNKIEPSFDKDVTGDGSYFLTKSKETYLYETESEADEKINDARQANGFESAKKTFKAGKISKKTGDILVPDYWKVVIVYKFVD